MIENVFKYIEILLPQHKCVTLPEFGAFILNKEGYSGGGNLVYDNHYVPSCTITFNSRLQHDDGVLTSYLQAVEGGSYEKASKELSNTIRKMRAKLLIEKEVNCGALGKIQLQNGNILFAQNKSYILPQYYGLTPLGLNTIDVLNKEIKHEVKVVSLKKKFIVAAASVAVVAMLALPSINITDNISLNNEQHAGYLKSLVKSSTTKLAVVEEQQPVIEDFSVNETSVPKYNENKSGRSYYIIVGGEVTVSRAEKLLDKFKQEGYNNAHILESPERYRIYVASFDSKSEAENYLIQFRKTNPKYDSAWLHSKKN